MKQLLCRPLIFTDESLTSYLARLADENGYSVSCLFHFCNKLLSLSEKRERTLDQPQYADTFEILSSLCKTLPSKLVEASFYRFSNIVFNNFSTMPLSDGSAVNFPQERKEKFFRLHSVAVCPECLQIKPYGQYNWLLTSSVICVQHNCFLIESRCYYSTYRIHVIQDLIEDLIEDRDRIYENIKSSPFFYSLSSDKLGLYAHKSILCWLNNRIDNDSDIWGIPNQSAKSLFKLWFLLFDLTFLMDSSMLSNVFNWQADRTGNTRHLLPPQTRYIMQTTAFKGLTDWPNGFCDFLSKIFYKLERNYSKNYAWSFLHNCFWNESECEDEFIQSAYDEFILKKQRYLRPASIKGKRIQQRYLFKRFQYISISWAAHLLNTTVDVVHRLISSGQLDSIDLEDTRTIWLNQYQVICLQKLWEERGISLPDAIKLLGVSKKTIIDLAQNNLLKVLRGPISPQKDSVWLFDLNSHLCWLDSQPQIMLTKDIKDNYLNLTTAAQKLSYLGIDVAHIIEKGMNYQIKTVLIRNEQEVQVKNYSNMFLHRLEVIKLEEKFLAEKNWVKVKEVAQRMRVKHTVVRQWAKMRLLTSVNTSKNILCFHRSEVETFINNHVFSEEAAEILGIGVLVVQKWARNGRLHPVAGGDNNSHRYLFKRSEIEKLRPENRLTAPQMANKLGISRSQLSVWIKQGKVKPVSGKGIDKSGQYLFLLDE